MLRFLALSAFISVAALCGQLAAPCRAEGPVAVTIVLVNDLPRAEDVSKYVQLEQPHGGGHIGFARGGLPERLDYLPQRLHEFFSRGV